MEKENIFEHASDHVIWEYLKLQDAEAWKLVWRATAAPRRYATGAFPPRS